MAANFSPWRVLRSVLVIVLVGGGVLAVQDSGYARLVPGPVPELPVRDSDGRWLVLTVGAEQVSRGEVLWTAVSRERLFRLVEEPDGSMDTSKAAAASAATDLVGSPVTVPYDLGDVQGPSAGLTLALASTDNTVRGALSNGRRIAVTGEITPDGDVLLVGGLEFKARALEDQHVDVLVVPRAEAAIFRGLVRGVDVIGVDTLDEAVEALCPGARPGLDLCN